jgi:CRP-like cAMP-binding protein
VKVEEQPSAPETYTDPFAGLGNDGLPEDSDGTNRRAALRGLARQAQSIGDYPASQRAIRELLREGVEDDEIHALQAENLKQIEAAYLARLGSLDRTPQLALTPDQLVWHNLDVHKGFVLSRVDGVLTARDIIDIVHLPRRDTIRLLAELVQDGILVMKKGR